MKIYVFSLPRLSIVFLLTIVFTIIARDMIYFCSTVALWDSVRLSFEPLYFHIQ